MLRSAKSTSVCAVALLFGMYESGSLSVTLAVLLTVLIAGGLTISVTVASALGLNVPSVQLTVEVPLHEPSVELTDTDVTPFGNVSLSVTLVAGASPSFVTLIVMVRFAP